MSPGISRLLLVVLWSVAGLGSEAEAKRRVKREWLLPPSQLEENVDHTKKEFIAKIRSDKDKDASVLYGLSGAGADQNPFNLFVVNPDDGFVRITGILDREKIPEFNLTGFARFRNGTMAETDILLRVWVTDQNDNAPTFKMQTASVRECSPAGTYVTQITATDADETGSNNSKVAYSIVSQDPAGAGRVFNIDRSTGRIVVKEPTLDRETHDLYKLIVHGVDLDGAAEGNTGTGTVLIDVQDVNDNAPTLEKESYSGNVDEGAVNVVVMRLKAFDKDLVKTDNWRAVFNIASGNEEEIFTIETDPVTNEGILKVVKPVDYEAIEEMDLKLMIENVAPLVNGTAIALGLEVDLAGPGITAGGGAGAGGGSGGGGGGIGGGHGPVQSGPGTKPDIKPGTKPGTKPDTKPDTKPGSKPGSKPDTKPDTKPGSKPATTPGKNYPIKIKVNNMPDGPGFKPKIKEVPVSEDPAKVKVPQVVTTYPAVDGDTGKLAENVRYAKGSDPDNWFTINEDTAEVMLNKVPDRESPYVVNGTYVAKILCMTKDAPSKTVTGTIAIKVEDINDHCPKLTSTHQSVCTDNKGMNISAVDEDPDSGPLSFKIIPEETRGKWTVEHVSETTAAFSALEPLWPGTYQLMVEVSDSQGVRCPDHQKVELEVCTCTAGEGCNLRAMQQGASATVGAPALGLLLLGLGLMLLVPLLLLFCQCGAAVGISERFADLPFDVKEYLIPYHTEGIGDDKEVPLLCAPIGYSPTAKVSTMALAGLASGSFNSKTANKVHQEMISAWMVDAEYGFGHHQNPPSTRPRWTQYQSYTSNEVDLYDEMALPDAFLHGYYSKKVMSEDLQCSLNDNLLVYDYEGDSSTTGSVGCCSLLESDSDLHFLDDLGPKFTTLAQICRPPKEIPQDTVASGQSSSRPVSLDAGSSVEVTKVQSTSSGITKANNSSFTLPSMHLQENVNFRAPSQTVLLQQQPLYYIVKPQVTSTVLVAEGPPLKRGTYMLNQIPVLQDAAARPTLLLHSNPTWMNYHIPGSQQIQTHISPAVPVQGKAADGVVEADRQGRREMDVGGGATPPGYVGAIGIEHRGMSDTTDVSGLQEPLHSVGVRDRKHQTMISAKREDLAIEPPASIHLRHTEENQLVAVPAKSGNDTSMEEENLSFLELGSPQEPGREKITSKIEISSALAQVPSTEPSRFVTEALGALPVMDPEGEVDEKEDARHCVSSELCEDYATTQSLTSSTESEQNRAKLAGEPHEEDEEENVDEPADQLECSSMQSQIRESDTEIEETDISQQNTLVSTQQSQQTWLQTKTLSEEEWEEEETLQPRSSNEAAMNPSRDNSNSESFHVQHPTPQLEREETQSECEMGEEPNESEEEEKAMAQYLSSQMEGGGLTSELESTEQFYQGFGGKGRIMQATLESTNMSGDEDHNGIEEEEAAQFASSDEDANPTMAESAGWKPPGKRLVEDEGSDLESHVHHRTPQSGRKEVESESELGTEQNESDEEDEEDEVDSADPSKSDDAETNFVKAGLRRGGVVRREWSGVVGTDLQATHQSAVISGDRIHSGTDVEDPEYISSVAEGMNIPLQEGWGKEQVELFAFSDEDASPSVSESAAMKPPGNRTEEEESDSESLHAQHPTPQSEREETQSGCEMGEEPNESEEEEKATAQYLSSPMEGGGLTSELESTKRVYQGFGGKGRIMQATSESTDMSEDEDHSGIEEEGAAQFASSDEDANPTMAESAAMNSLGKRLVEESHSESLHHRTPQSDEEADSEHEYGMEQEDSEEWEKIEAEEPPKRYEPEADTVRTKLEIVGEASELVSTCWTHQSLGEPQVLQASLQSTDVDAVGNAGCESAEESWTRTADVDFGTIKMEQALPGEAEDKDVEDGTYSSGMEYQTPGEGSTGRAFLMQTKQPDDMEASLSFENQQEAIASSKGGKHQKSSIKKGPKSPKGTCKQQ
ncbi:uncharacterized protein LOC114769657 [Denticeps clupeoides]|uniref:uncharacterized protein LOC114769657 n=1 Tax=Denticeps clupeoides TaxID=299321 RepID=UPI0010A45FAA|nr:uncharacterized protein LOC114769657 [Denticeps clupeoides]